MLEFLAGLTDFRRKCILERPTSFIAKVSRSYFLLLEANKILDTSELVEVNELLLIPPKDPEELFHYLWFLNSHARYECFITKNFKAAEEVLDRSLHHSKDLLTHTFAEDNVEKQCLVLILCLNQARLSYYKEEFLLSAQQLKCLKDYFNGTAPDQWRPFKKEVDLLLRTHGKELHRGIREDHLDYFLPKIAHLENKLIKVGAITGHSI